MRMLLAALSLASTTGCVMDPLDGDDLASTDQSFELNGLYNQPNARVIANYFRYSSDAWTYLRETRSRSQVFSPGWYQYAISNTVVPSNGWRMQTDEAFVARVRVIDQGQFAFVTFNESARQCVSTAINDLGQSIADAGAACSSGQEVRLHVDAADVVGQQAIAEFAPIRCAESTQPVFRDGAPNDALIVTLRADFARINGAPLEADAQSSGTMSYVTPQGKFETHLVNIKARGGTRFSGCGFRPLTVEFDGSPGGTLFAGSDKVKIVTHCGARPGQPPPFVGTSADHNQRVRMEHYVYQVFDALQTTSLKTRLAFFQYQDPSGALVGSGWGFFREKEEAAAARCGMSEAAPGAPQSSWDSTSAFQAQLHASMGFNASDFFLPDHNAVAYRRSNGSIFFAPYDWDFSGVVRPDTVKTTLSENAQEMVDLLNSAGTVQERARARAQAYGILRHASELERIAAEAFVDANNRARLTQWVHGHLELLRDYLEP